MIEKIKEKLQNQQVEFVDIDGIRVSNEKGWWLIRSSNTQNAISLRAEANKEEYMKQILEEVSLYLRPFFSDIEEILKRYE